MTYDQDPVLFCYEIEPSGGVRKLEGEAAAECLKSDRLAWAHLDATNPNAESWLRTHIDYLDPLIIEALLAENTRPRVEEIGDGALVILRGVNMNDNADPEDMVALRMWVDAHRVITLRRRPLKAVREIEEKMQRAAIMKNAGDVLVHVSAKLFQNMDPFVSNLMEELDDLEEELADSANAKKRRDITDLRKKAIIYRRYFGPQKDVMVFLKSSDVEWLDARHRRHLQENQDRLTRYIEDLDAVRERAQIIKDELANVMSEKLNKNLYILSIVTAIFLPLSYLTGLLGINVGGMPGADNPDAFWIVCGMSSVLLVIQIIILKMVKWF